MTTKPRSRQRVNPLSLDNDREITRAIDREHAITWHRMEVEGVPSFIERYPAVRRLLEAIDAADECGRLTNGRFSYHGRSYRVRREGVGRLVVIHPETERVIGTTSLFSK